LTADGEKGKAQLTGLAPGESFFEPEGFEGPENFCGADHGHARRWPGLGSKEKLIVQGDQ
jgi:hypothetical protein